MNFSIKQKLLFSLAFGFYQLLISWFFGSFKFLKNESNEFLYLLIIFLVFSLLEFAYLNFILKSLKRKGFNKLLFSVSFLSIGLFGSSLMWIIFSEEMEHYLIFVSSFIIASFLPTLISILYFIFKETEEKFSKLTSISLKTNAEASAEEEKVFHLENSNGKILLEVPISKIICFEANDNYVLTYYLKNETDLAKSMERISLKKIEEMLNQESVVFKRVHKSYLINPTYVDEVKGRAQAYKIKMNYFNTLVPVSRSYDINSINR